MSEAPPPGFPFVAVVGLDDVKLALLIGAVEPRLGGVLLRGEKGSAKTTLARGLAELLPGDPPPPFVDLPLGATEDRVVGTLDLAAALKQGEARFRPGLLAAADKGLLYVDEVNLLPDHLVDVLLDVAVSGVNRVERDAVSHEHMSRFFLVGSMNTEEGELRPQLLDRFGLSVEVRSSTEPAERAEAVRRRLAFDADPAGFSTEWSKATTELGERLERFEPSELPPALIEVAARMAVALGADGLRADIALCRAAAARAGLEGRPTATLEDLEAVAPLALGHRRRRGPFDEPGVTQAEIAEALEQATSPVETPADEREPGRASSPGGEADGPRSNGGTGGGAPEPEHADPPPAGSDPVTAQLALGGERRSLYRRSATPQASSRGRTVSDRVPGGRGRVVAAVPAGENPGRVAVAATLARTAEHRRVSVVNGVTAPPIEAADILQVVAEHKPARLVVMCVDTSGSMGTEARARAAKGAVLRLLTDAYQRRDRVAVVGCSGAGASVVLRPTASVEVARARLEALPTGGRTPLAEAIVRGVEVCLSPSSQGYSPVLVLVSDGRATAAPDGLDPVTAALEAADRVARARVTALVVDVEAGSGGVGLRLGEELAERMGARHVRLDSPTSDGIERAVRAVLTSLDA